MAVAAGSVPLVLARGNLGSADAGGVRINVFVRGANGHLLERYWDGAQWNANDTGLGDSGDPVAVTRGNTGSTDNSLVRINLFVRGANGDLWERYWG
jgi:hypothetical protein